MILSNISTRMGTLARSLFRSYLMKPVRYLPLFALIAIHAEAATISQTSIVSTVVPDNDDVGLVNTQTIVLAEPGTVTDVSVSITFSGGWNGDLYAYLASDTGFAVLLNRPGRSASMTDGAGSSGMSITISSGATEDVHTGLPLSGSSVTGTFQPDGRETDPALALDTDARTALLDSFNGIDGAGVWTLFVADQAAGGTSTLESWTLNLTVVPEPTTGLLMGFATLMAFRRRRADSK